MAARFVFPPAEKSARLTHELENVPSGLKKDHAFGTHRMVYDPTLPLPHGVYGLCDGHRLYVQSVSDRRVVSWGNMWLYVLSLPIGVIALADLVAGRDVGVYELFIFLALISTALFNTWRNSRRAFTKFIVFDRDSGLVLFPKTRKWPEFTVPFEKVEVYSMTMIGKGGAHFTSHISALARPKGMRGRRKEWFMMENVHNELQLLEQWCFINRFMDRSHSDPVPRESYFTWVDVHWFIDQGLTLDQIVKEKGAVIYDRDTGWIDYPAKLPPPSEQDYLRAESQARGVSLEELYRIHGLDKSGRKKETEEDSIYW